MPAYSGGIWRGNVVALVGHINERSYSTSSRVSTETGDRSRVYRLGILPSRPGQLSMVTPPWVGEISASDGCGYR